MGVGGTISIPLNPVHLVSLKISRVTTSHRLGVLIYTKQVTSLLIKEF